VKIITYKIYRGGDVITENSRRENARGEMSAVQSKRIKIKNVNLKWFLEKIIRPEILI